MANFYIVMNKMTAWGVGKTKEQAIQNARQYGTQEYFLGEMEKLMGSRREVALNGGGFYLEPISLLEWDDKLVDADSYALARLAWTQQEYNSIAPLNPVIDTQYLTTVEDVAHRINARHDIDFSIESVAAYYALSAAREAGRGFSKKEIEYHLNVLVAAQANFDYVIALGRAMSIASLIHDE